MPAGALLTFSSNPAPVNTVIPIVLLSVPASVPTGTGLRPQGYYSFEHLLIHNDLVRAYTMDQTGALSEAFAGATPAPTEQQTEAILTQYASNQVPILLQAGPRVGFSNWTFRGLHLYALGFMAPSRSNIQERT